MINVRQASPEHADIASKLILASGTNSLCAMFEVSPEYNAVDYLRYAFAQPSGQFSHTAHIVAEMDGELAGIASFWQSPPCSENRQATLASLIAFFGAEQVAEIARRSMLLQGIIPVCQPGSLGLGHVAVSPEYQRKGVATALLNQMHILAVQQGKHLLELDVECDNQVAISLYQETGFGLVSTTQPGEAAQAVGFTAHHHMTKRCQTLTV